MYRSSIYLNINNITSLALTFDYSFFTMDQKPGFGFYDIDSIFNLNILILIIIIILLFSFFTSFRSLYFPKLWYINNSEYL